MQAAGLIDAGEFEVEWPDLAAASESDQLDNAAKMAAINKACIEGAQPPAFDGNEIRRVAGFDEREEDELEPGEGEPGADDMDEADDVRPRAPAALRAAA
jgi:hypothetical protein